MAKEEYEEETNVDEFEDGPEALRDNDEISDSEEAFMEGYEKGAGEEEEEDEVKDTEEEDLELK